MVIEPTEEIQRAYAEAWYRSIGMDEPDVQQMVAAELREPLPWRIEALKAVLALVERTYDVTPKAVPVEHRPKGEIWWNHYFEQYQAECVCGEEFTGWPRSDAEERLLDHLEREARP